MGTDSANARAARTARAAGTARTAHTALVHPPFKLVPSGTPRAWIVPVLEVNLRPRCT